MSNNSDPELQSFTRAKEDINNIFSSISEYVKTAVQFLESNIDYKDVINPVDQIRPYVEQVEGIRNILSRNHMKIIVCGRNSTGKSTLMNSMLKDNVFPQGMGHTTSCCLQVEGTKEKEPYVCKDGSSVKENIQCLEKLAKAVNKDHLDEKKLLRIFWPQDKCTVLRHDVVLIDSPGAANKSNIDECIMKYCSDADVFVFMTHAESTLTEPEQVFFKKVSQKFSKSNIFLLINHWDKSDDYEPEEVEKVRQQHTELATEFLVEELKLYSLAEAAEKIFFISAKECLQFRCPKEKQRSSLLGNGNFLARYEEFQDFEEKMKACVSKSAMETKFKPHLIKGKDIVNVIRNAMDAVYKKSIELKSERMKNRESIDKKLNYIKKRFVTVEERVTTKIQTVVNHARLRIELASKMVLEDLPKVIEQFSRPPWEGTYEEQLNEFVASRLERNLKNHLFNGPDLKDKIVGLQEEMAGEIVGLSAPEVRSRIEKILARRRPSNSLHEFDYYSFHRYLQIALFRQTSDSDDVTNAATAVGAAGAATTVGGLLMRLPFFASLATGAVIGVGGFLVGKAIELVEKEKKVKEEYSRLARMNLILFFQSAAEECSNGIHGELVDAFSELRQLVDEEISGMAASEKHSEKEIQILENMAVMSEKLKKDSYDITTKLDHFERTYLRT